VAVYKSRLQVGVEPFNPGLKRTGMLASKEIQDDLPMRPGSGWTHRWSRHWHWQWKYSRALGFF
jgi:hypothetical protein